MNPPQITLKEVFGHRFQKSFFVYFPLNISFVIGLISISQKLSSYKVPTEFLIKEIIKFLPLILFWAALYSQTLYSYFDAPPKKPSTEAENDIELGPVAPPAPPAPPTPPAPSPPSPSATSLPSRPLPPSITPEIYATLTYPETELIFDPLFLSCGVPGPPRPNLWRSV